MKHYFQKLEISVVLERGGKRWALQLPSRAAWRGFPGCNVRRGNPCRIHRSPRFEERVGICGQLKRPGFTGRSSEKTALHRTCRESLSIFGRVLIGARMRRNYVRPTKNHTKGIKRNNTRGWEYGKSTIYRPVIWAKNSFCHLKPFGGNWLLQNNLSWLIHATCLDTAAPHVQRSASETLCQEGRRMIPHVFIAAFTDDWSEWVVKSSSPLLEGWLWGEVFRFSRPPELLAYWHTHHWFSSLPVLTSTLPHALPGITYQINHTRVPASGSADWWRNHTGTDEIRTSRKDKRCEVEKCWDAFVYLCTVK